MHQSVSAILTPTYWYRIPNSLNRIVERYIGYYGLCYSSQDALDKAKAMLDGPSYAARSGVHAVKERRVGRLSYPHRQVTCPQPK